MLLSPSKVLAYSSARLHISSGKSFTRALRLIPRTHYEGRALLYYKSLKSPFDVRLATHTNEIELWIWVETLNLLGFEVDLLDRTAGPETQIYPPYDAYFGLGTSGSSRNYLVWLERAGATRNFLIATTPNPADANRIRSAHLERFFEKYGVVPQQTRLDPFELEMPKRYDQSTGVLAYGNERSWSYESHAKHHSRVHTVGPTALSLPANEDVEFHSVAEPSFIYFAGTGGVAKGLDIVLETFLESPFPRLSVVGECDEAITSVFGRAVEKSANVRFFPKIRPSRRQLARVARLHQVQILPSPAEASATSVATLMPWGTLPFITEEVGYPGFTSFSLGSFGAGTKARLRQSIEEYVGLTESERMELARRCAEEGQRFSIENFREELKSSLNRFLS